jgi:hypothetical protein
MAFRLSVDSRLKKRPQRAKLGGSLFEVNFMGSKRVMKRKRRQKNLAPCITSRCVRLFRS